MRGFCWGGAVVLAPLAIFAGVVAAAAVGVSDLADAGMALPADLAGVATVGVASLADAEMAFPTDLTEMADVIVHRRDFGVVRALCTEVMWIVSMWAVWAMVRLAWIARRQLQVAPAPW